MVFTWHLLRHVGAQSKREKVFQEFDLIIMQNWAIICICFVQKHDRFILWLKTISIMQQIIQDGPAYW